MTKLQSRKQLRKQQRKEKKARKNEYYQNRKTVGKYVVNPNKQQETNSTTAKVTQLKPNNVVGSAVQDAALKKEKKEQERLQKQMQKQRADQLKRANYEEDKAIKRLEKQLKLNKRKTKSLPKTFAADGLDYLLEVCDPESISKVVAAEQHLIEGNDEFSEDLDLIAGGAKENEKSEDEDTEVEQEEGSGSELEGAEEEDELEDGENEQEELGINEIDLVEEDDTEISEEDEQEEIDSESNDDDNSHCKRKQEQTAYNQNKKRKTVAESSCDDNSSDADLCDDEENSKNTDRTWTDIYGRLRTIDGAIVKEDSEKYVPPAVRAKMVAAQSDDKKLLRLRRQLKGLVNRLAESNMHNISKQIEDLYMNNSRNDMNETLTNLLLDSLVTRVLTPERLLMEHVMLVAILHANVGTEVGAHFLQDVVKRFDNLTNVNQEVEDKTLDNVVLVLAQLYNFKVFHCQLIYQIIDKLADGFEDEKRIECILHILKSVGFTLRKDDPLALKNLILNIQKKAAAVQEETKKDNIRIKFMLDILLAIKNNNVTKIPNYDTTYSEHLKKLLKGLIRKGNYISQLNISLEDLLKADERGKWWVVGSAWTGNAPEVKQKPLENCGYSQKLLALAKKQRMNTDTRRSIFCTIMSAEDYLDAFEKLLHLGLKGPQEQEIINVILHCCLQEKKYNPFYAVLAQKFCECDRKYQMTIKCSIWDKLKMLSECSANQLAHLSKLLIHLFIEKGLPISTLKIIQFSELDKISLRFMRQILLGILLHENTEACLAVFEKIAIADKLKMFKESLRLFIHHFVLRNLKEGTVAEDKKHLLESRAQMVEKLLNAKERNKF